MIKKIATIQQSKTNTTINIPKSVRDLLGLCKGDLVTIMVNENNVIEIKKINKEDL